MIEMINPLANMLNTAAKISELLKPVVVSKSYYAFSEATRTRRLQFNNLIPLQILPD